MTLFPQAPGPIGVFDSGYGGLSVFDKIHQLMPEYDYLYLGDNARTPYGPRSFEVVYQFTRQAVRFLFAQGCHLVILACNTASAKALRTIQQRDLPEWDASRRVLGVIRPTVELMDSISHTKHVGVLGTAGTIASNSYALEIGKMFPHIQVVGEACPMWVPLVECDESRSPGADYFVKRHLDHILSVVYARGDNARAAGRVCGRELEGLFATASGDGPLPVEEWTLFLFDDRVRREVHGGRLPFLEWSRGGDPGDFGLK